MGAKTETYGLPANLRTYGFLSGWYFLLSVRYARLISLSEADLSMSNSL